MCGICAVVDSAGKHCQKSSCLSQQGRHYQTVPSQRQFAAAVCLQPTVLLMQQPAGPPPCALAPPSRTAWHAHNTIHTSKHQSNAYPKPNQARTTTAAHCACPLLIARNNSRPARRQPHSANSSDVTTASTCRVCMTRSKRQHLTSNHAHMLC